MSPDSKKLLRVAKADMCGIFGTTLNLGASQISNVLSLLNHRGPDSHGVEQIAVENTNTDLLFIHTRLAIQDLSPSGHQPMISRDKRWWLTYNGELYNHYELRKKLNVDFRGTSDTETLIEYISAYGVEQTLKDINGIYGFAVVDLLEARLYVARDPFGVKPVYYTRDAAGFSFSSEIKPLRSVTEKPAELDSEGLGQFLNLRYVPSPSTLLVGIQRLQPGHFLTFELETRASIIKSFIVPRYERFEGSKKDAVRQYKDCLSDSIKRQLISDVPVGVLLSAGIDSSLIAAMAREHSSDLTAHTVGFGEKFDECEIDGAAQTARLLGIRHESTTVDPLQLVDSLSDIVKAVEEPLGTTSIMPMWYLTKAAKKTATVVLAGQGNDEPWAGYRRYQIELILERLPFLKAPGFRVGENFLDKVNSDGVKRGLSCLGYRDETERFGRAYALFSQHDLGAFGLNGSSAAQNAIGYWINNLADCKTLTSAEKMMRVDARMNLSDDLLLYGDKTSMNCALEVRVPMLDPHVVNFVESLPLSYKASLKTTKIVHREMANEFLPAEIINRPKKGFQVPFGLWAKTVWRDYIQANLLDSNLGIRSVIDGAGIDAIWHRHESGRMDCTRQLFALLTLSLWIEEFLTSSSGAE